MNPRVTGTLRLDGIQGVWSDIHLDGTLIRSVLIYRGSPDVAERIVSGEYKIDPNSRLAIDCQYSDNP